MSFSPPQISVLMAVYNGSRYVAEAIESILNQTFTDFEFLIIEDGSTDNTVQILQDYANRDPRIKLIQNEQNIGLTKSLNKGLKLAQGKYIARQDADDVSLPHRFEQQIAVFAQNPAAVLVSCSLELIDATGKTVG
ncbi:MAG TPA: glycosyltransferase, partial [Allocoleopsis sp.]